MTLETDTSAAATALPAERQALFDYLLRLGDNAVVLSHRLGEWCGHAPVLEEDIALINVALDLLGQARSVMTYAGEVEGRGRDEDALVYRRDGIDYRNVLLVEQPNEEGLCPRHRPAVPLRRLALRAADSAAAVARRAPAGDRRQVGQGGQLPPAPLLGMDGAAGRRHGREPCADPGGAGRALALHRRALRGRRGGGAGRRRRPRPRSQEPLPGPGRTRSTGCWPRRRCAGRRTAGCRAAGAPAGTASTSATSWPRCSSCSAPIRTPAGRRRGSAHVDPGLTTARRAHARPRGVRAQRARPGAGAALADPGGRGRSGDFRC